MSDTFADKPYDKLVPDEPVSNPAIIEQHVSFPFVGSMDIEQWLRAVIAEQVRRETEQVRKELELQLQQQLQAWLTSPPELTISPSSSPMAAGIVTPPLPELRERVVIDPTESSEEMLEIFHQEAEAHLRDITASIAVLEQVPEDKEVLQGIRRSTHTLKAVAAMMDLTQVTELVHIFENLLDQIMGGTIQVNNQVLSVILDTSEALESLVLGQASKYSSSATAIDVLRIRYQVLLGQMPETDAISKGLLPYTDRSAVLETKVAEELTSGSAHLDQFGDHTLAVAVSSAAVDQGELSVRIKLKKLDEIMNLFGELLVNRNILDERMYHLMRIITSGGSSSEIEAIIQECQRTFRLQTHLSTHFQSRLLQMRLVPLSMMIPSLYRTARATGLRQGKEIEFTVEGEETEFDRVIYEEVAGPLLHLIRNAVTHGIEMPDVREAANKPRTGRIMLSARHENDQVVITVQDDGKGINIEQVRVTAIARGLLDTIMPSSEQSILNLIFHSGFSTSEVITEDSGRGVGLDVVSNAVTRLQGVYNVETELGYNSTFTMKIPRSLQIQLAVLVCLGKQSFAILLNQVKQITQLDDFRFTRAKEAQTIKVGDESYVLIHLASLLSLPPGKIDTPASVLLVVANSKQYALLVDRVIGTQEIVSKSVGPNQLSGPGVSGVTILGDGKDVLILDLIELLSQQLPSLPVKESGEVLDTPEQEQQCVLVVDDSPSVRRVVGNLLKKNGWKVLMARDGVEAMELVTKHPSIAAMLIDIEMPRMDGYELIATLRHHKQYQHLPLIVLTSRAAAKHQQRAMSLGADAYLVKPYQDDEVLNTLNAITHGASA